MKPPTSPFMAAFNQMKSLGRKRNYPHLTVYNLTAGWFGGKPFLGGPVRVLQTILKWGPSVQSGRWFAN